MHSSHDMQHPVQEKKGVNYEEVSSYSLLYVHMEFPVGILLGHQLFQSVTQIIVDFCSELERLVAKNNFI